MTYANGTAVIEVEVDVETGGVSVRNIVFAHDCGRAIHPRIVDGQVIGGIAHGIGNTLYEHMDYDENGQPLTTNLAEYLLVTATEMPPITLLHMESPSPLNQLGIKGVGESGVIPIGAAIASAIDDALESFSVSVKKLPSDTGGSTRSDQQRPAIASETHSIFNTAHSADARCSLSNPAIS